MLEAASQARHAIEPGPLHSKQEVWQLLHVATLPPTNSTKVAFLHSPTHSPPERKGVKALVHVRQCVLFGPEHVPQSSLQGAQTPWSACDEPGGAVAAYLPRGVQSATHASGRLENGCVDEQLRQSAAIGPEQVAHEPSHETQASAVALDPPEHV